ncbi:hypothetical protein, partial [Sphingomicrobium astaxanthinifaciens]|uniref:hypothetical protein n=1 Tax=Sphingomicrobium astaxanthinifaciens TaxID=1227949 RepID=UPI001FCC550B
NIEFGSRKEVDAAFIDIVQVQGNKPASMWISLIDGSDGAVTTDNQSRDFANGLGVGDKIDIAKITIIRGTTEINVALIKDAEGYRVTGVQQGDRIEFEAVDGKVFDQVLVLGRTGKFDIGAFGTLEPPLIPDLVLDFAAKATDGDLDSAIASWSVGIDGTGIFDDGVVAGIAAPLVASSSSSMLASEQPLAPEMHILGEDWVDQDLILV